MPQIKIIKAALREIQKLSCSDCETVYEILRSLSQETDTDTVKLRQYNDLGLFRTKKNKVRVIWKKEDNNIVIIKAASRDDAYENDLKYRDFNNQESIIDKELFQELELELELQSKEICEQPAYKWSQENSDWYKFVFNNYRYSPVITGYQKEFLDKVFNSFSTYRYSESNEKLNNQTCIIQSAPGTGKTLCATLFACEVNLQQEWNIILIVPDRLRQDIAEYSTVKQVLDRNNFWLVTFEELLRRLNSELTNRLASPEEELAALERV
ncbi:MAG: DEAD/DEAH box helicase family protein, partial [Cyanobacteria bacterium J06643_5]